MFFAEDKSALEASLRDALVDVLRDELPALLRQATTKPYLTKKELMELTGWSSRQVEYAKTKRRIPFVRRGRLVLFPTDEVFAFLGEGRVSVKNGERGGKR